MSGGKVVFNLQLETAARPDELGRRPVDRLRAFIKKADRGYGLKVIRLSEATDGALPGDMDEISNAATGRGASRATAADER